MSETANLLPCPWCGAFEKSYLQTLHAETLISYHSKDHYYVRCLSCMAQGPAGSTKEEAIKFWHTLKRDDEKSYLQEFIDAGSILFNTLYMDFIDFNGEDKDKVPETLKIIKTFLKIEAEFTDELQPTSSLLAETDYICRTLSFYIDQGAFGYFSDEYPTFPLRWKKRPPLLPALLNLLKEAREHIDPNTSTAEKLLVNIREALSKYEEAQLKPKE